MCCKRRFLEAYVKHQSYSLLLIVSLNTCAVWRLDCVFMCSPLLAICLAVLGNPSSFSDMFLQLDPR